MEKPRASSLKNFEDVASIDAGTFTESLALFRLYVDCLFVEMDDDLKEVGKDLPTKEAQLQERVDFLISNSRVMKKVCHQLIARLDLLLEDYDYKAT